MNEKELTGRPITPTGLRVRASRHADDALKALADVAANGTDPAARVEAARTILSHVTGNEKGAVHAGE